MPAKQGKGSFCGDVAGIWREQWNQNQQSIWIGQFYKMALSKIFVDSVTYSDLVDNNNNVIPSGGLLTKDLEPKKAFRVLKKFHKMLLSR